MDINFSAQDLEFRDEVRAFFASEYDAKVAESLSSGQGEDYKEAIVGLAEKASCQRLDCAGLAKRVRRYWLVCHPEVYL